MKTKTNTLTLARCGTCGHGFFKEYGPCEHNQHLASEMQKTAERTKERFREAKTKDRLAIRKEMRAIYTSHINTYYPEITEWHTQVLVEDILRGVSANLMRIRARDLNIPVTIRDIRAIINLKP